MTDLRVATITGRDAILDGAAVDGFRASLRGPLISSGSSSAGSHGTLRFLTNASMKSMGIGNSVVVLLPAPISSRVCR